MKISNGKTASIEKPINQPTNVKNLTTNGVYLWAC
jgi:hypothetical protein